LGEEPEIVSAFGFVLEDTKFEKGGNMPNFTTKINYTALQPGILHCSV
jgi:hypothetical protein